MKLRYKERKESSLMCSIFFNCAPFLQVYVHYFSQEALNEEEFQDQDSSFLSHCTTITVQLSLNVMFIFLMTGIALLMWDLLGRHSTYLYNSSDGSGSSSNNTMTMAIIISLIMNVLPMCFSWIVRYGQNIKSS